MTAAPIEINFWLSAREHRRAFEELARLSAKGKDPMSYLLTNPIASVVINAFLAYICFEWLTRSLPELWRNGLNASDLFGHLFGLFVTWLLVRNIVNFAAPYLSRHKRLGEGVTWGAHRLLASPDALTLSLSASETTYRWTAFLGLQKTKRLLLLMLTPRIAVPVPRWAFSSKAEEEAFCRFVEERIEDSTPGPWNNAGGPGS